jgi:hypothetical protein
MKKLFDVLILTLAINFIAIASALIWLHQTHRLDRQKVLAIKEIVFPTTAPSTQPTEEQSPTTQPTLRLDELLASKVGRSTSEQVEFLQHTFDAQMAQLDRRQRELSDLQRQVDLAKTQLATDRSKLQGDQQQLSDREQQATKLASDKGFQDALDRYNAMSGKQVKQIFMTLDDQTVVNFLQAMEPRPAARVIKEFKSPEELARIQKILEKMRLAQTPPPGTSATAASASAAPTTPKE